MKICKFTNPTRYVSRFGRLATGGTSPTFFPANAGGHVPLVLTRKEAASCLVQWRKAAAKINKP